MNNIYGIRKRKTRRQRRIIVGLCITICFLSVITGVYFIVSLMNRNATPSSVTQATASSVADVSSAPVLTGTESSQTYSSVPNDTSGQTVTPEQRTAALTSLKSAISTLLDSQSGRYSAYYVNLANGETLGYNESSPMVAASSIKIAFNTDLYKQAAAGLLSMDTAMQYNSAPYPQGDFEAGTGSIQTSADGTSYTLSDLSHLSITISDNCATNMILRYLGGVDKVNEYMSGISAVVNYRIAASYTDYLGQTQSGKQRTSAVDLAMYAKDLYTLDKASPDDYAVLIDDLSHTEYNWGIPAGVPSAYPVAHKVGFNPSYGSNNDVGIVFAQEDYILCVMTESGDGAKAQDLIGQVSKLVSDYITSCYS